MTTNLKPQDQDTRLVGATSLLKTPAQALETTNGLTSPRLEASPTLSAADQACEARGLRPAFWQGTIRVGNLEFPRFMAAPLDGVTDSPLRRLIREFSPTELLFTEMRHVACVANERDGKSLKYDRTTEHPLCFQVSANTERFIDEAIEKVIEAGFDMFNLNIGCPARCVIKSGSGSALMADIPRLTILLNRMRKALNGRIPLTVKMRAGYKEKNAVDVAKACVDAGVEMLIIHPRTQPEMFHARLDFELTRQVKEAINIPLIFSGNLNNFERVKKTYDLTGVDGFMIGRALWGCPWKMQEIINEAQGLPFPVDNTMMLTYALKHLELNSAFYGEHGFTHFKKQLPQYIRGVTNAAQMRQQLLRSTTEQVMRSELLRLLEESQIPALPAQATYEGSIIQL